MPDEYEDFENGDYELVEDVEVTPATEALPFPEVDSNDDEASADPEAHAVGFTSVTGSTPGEAIAEARAGVLRGTFWGVGQCLKTVRQYYDVNSQYPTAASGWVNADYKHPRSDGRDCPRGAPVWWTGGSSGAGHVAISTGGGVCISTDWKRSGRADYANINDITNTWGLDFKGYTNDINSVFVWKPVPPKDTVALHNLKPGDRHADVLKVKRVLHHKGYRGFLVNSNKYGRGVKKAYAKYQTRLGYKGSDANGVPGRNSLEKLGFKVKT